VEYYPGITPHEFMRVNLPELKTYAAWLLNRRGLSLSDPQIHDLLVDWFLSKKSSYMLRTYDPQRSTFETFLRACLARHLIFLWNVSQRQVRTVSMDQALTDSEGTLHDVLGETDALFEYSEASTEIEEFMRWCPQHVHSWKSKKRLLMLTRSGIEIRYLPKYLKISKQRAHQILVAIRVDLQRFRDCTASLC